MFRSKTVSAIGIDIGSYSVKCVEITHSKGVIELQRAAIYPVSQASTQAAALKTFFETSSTPAGRRASLSQSVRISMAGPSVVIRRITLPIMTHSDLKGAIHFEAENHLPYAVEECALDFQILNQVPNQTMMNVLLVAAKRDFIQERLDMLSQANVQPEIIDLDVFCLSNAFEMLSPAAENRIYGLLNIGHQMSSFTVVQDKLPFFAREISYGGLSVTNALAELKGISAADAETLKLSRAADVLDDLKASTQKAFEPLAEELKQSIDFCEGELGEPVPSIGFSGGGAGAFEAAKVLSAAIGKPVTLWDNLNKMKIAQNVDRKFLEEHSGKLNIAFGMALRGAHASK